MRINIQSLHFNAYGPLTHLVLKKVDKLSRFGKKILAADVCLSLEKASDRQNKVCEIRLVIPGNDLVAKRRCETFEESVAFAVDALERQLGDKDKNHRNREVLEN